MGIPTMPARGEDITSVLARLPELDPDLVIARAYPKKPELDCFRLVTPGLSAKVAEYAWITYKSSPRLEQGSTGTFLGRVLGRIGDQIVLLQDEGETADALRHVVLRETKPRNDTYVAQYQSTTAAESFWTRSR